MPDSVAGLFRSRSEAEAALGNLKDAGLTPDVSVSTRATGRRGLGDRLDVALAMLREAGALEAEPVEAPIRGGRPRPDSG